MMCALSLYNYVGNNYTTPENVTKCLTDILVYGIWIYQKLTLRITKKNINTF